MMKYTKISVLMLACAMSASSIRIKSETIKQSLISRLSSSIADTERKVLYGMSGAMLGLLSYLSYDYAMHAPLLDSPVAYKNQPTSVAELQEMLHYALQEDYAVMVTNMEHRFIKDGLHGMSKTHLCNHSRVGAIELATATRDKKTKNITISWASIPGLSEKQVEELTKLQHQYVREFYRAIRPDKKRYEIPSFTKKSFGQKSAIYYYAPTMHQKRVVQQAHMQQAIKHFQAMLAMLKAPEAAPAK